MQSRELVPGQVYKYSASAVARFSAFASSTDLEAMRFVAIDEARVRYVDTSEDTVGCPADPGDYEPASKE